MKIRIENLPGKDMKKMVITKETTDKKIPYSGYAADPNSTFFYRVIQELKKQGYDVIKKQMTKDKEFYHMTDDNRQYIRTRKTTGKNTFYAFDPKWPLMDLAIDEYNKEGEAILLMQMLEDYR